jgi:NitT/TauT family transport system ATP-binding protein
MYYLEVKNLTKKYGNVTALSNFSLEVKKGELVCVIGQSGCGKSTLLGCISGIKSIDGGSIKFEGGLKKPKIAAVFQEDRLLPWYTAEKNIELAVEQFYKDPEEKRKRIEKVLDLVRLEEAKHKYPLELSGGMRQRISIARALAIDPDLLLMDEPFSSLDEITAEHLRIELEKIWEETKKTIIFITHDISEAVCLGDRIIVMTGAPGRNFGEIKVNLRRPRNKTSEAFFTVLKKATRMLADASKA